MRKNTFLYAMAALCLYFSILTTATAQQTAPVTVGGKVPDVIWNEPLTEISGKSDRTIKLSQFKGKPIILDYWASWCEPCLKNMIKLDSLAQLMHHAFQPVMLDTKSRIDSLKDIRGFVKNFLKDKVQFASPLMAYNPLLQGYFPHRVVPHYIWIGKDGQVKAITDHKALTVANLECLIADKPVDYPIKTR